MVWRVEYFTKVNRYVETLSIDDEAKIKQAISFLENYGPFLRSPFVKKIEKSLFELRIIGQNSYRIFFTFKNKIYYLVHIFKKKSQKTPKKEIKLALDRIKQLI